MLLAAVYHTLNYIEALWISVALASAIVTGFNLYDAWLDRKALIAENIGNGRRVVASVTIFTESTRILIHLIFLSIGILAAFLPDPPPQVSLPEIQVVLTGMVRWGLIASSFILMTQSILLRWMRYKLRGG